MLLDPEVDTHPYWIDNDSELAAPLGPVLGRRRWEVHALGLRGAGGSRAAAERGRHLAWARVAPVPG